jgi:hypothetical protein
MASTTLLIPLSRVSKPAKSQHKAQPMYVCPYCNLFFAGGEHDHEHRVDGKIVLFHNPRYAIVEGLKA